MKLSQNYKFRRTQKFNEVKPFRFYTGIVTGLISAITIYSSLITFRFFFIILSRTEDCDFLSFTDSEIRFYNFFFAFLSVIIAQSLTINFWLNKPRSFLGRYEYKRKIIINEQRTFNWYFIAWFSKLVFLCIFFFTIVIKKGYYTLNLYSEYRYLFIFIIIVLFLQTWNSLRITFLKRSLFKMLSVATILVILSLGLSEINIINYDKFNQNCEESCCQKCIPKNLPIVKYYNKFSKCRINIYMNNEALMSKDSFIKINNLKYPINKISAGISKLTEYKSFNYPNSTCVKLYINENVRMKNVNFLKSQLRKNNILNTAYAVFPENMKYDKRYYYNYGVYSRINTAFNSDSLIKQFHIISAVKESKKLFLRADNSENIYLNNKMIDEENLSRIIKNKIFNNNKLLIVIDINDEMNFKTYFKMWYTYYEAVYELRNEYAYVYFTKRYNELYGKELYEVNKKYPFKIFEMTNRMKRYFDK